MKSIAHLLTLTFLIALLIDAVVLVAGWLLGWNTSTQYSNGLFVVGMIFIVFGALSVMGNNSFLSSEPLALYSQSAGDMSLHERAQRWVADTRQGYGTFIYLLLIGAFMIGLAILIPNIFY